jgi:hypothetical protein
MVNKKHQKHLYEVFLYIWNRLSVGIDIEKVKTEVLTKFYSELAWYDVTPEMHENFVEELVLQAYFYLTKRIFGEEDCETKITEE